MASYDSKSHLLAQIQDIRENRDKVVDEYQKTRNRAEKAEKAVEHWQEATEIVMAESKANFNRAIAAEVQVVQLEEEVYQSRGSSEAALYLCSRCNAKDEEIAALKANLARVEQNLASVLLLIRAREPSAK